MLFATSVATPTPTSTVSARTKEISEDDQRRAETEIQKITDRFIGEVDKVVAEKDKEIMTV